MVIFIDGKGVAEIVTPERVFQGSSEVTRIVVVGPHPAQTAMQIGFILPNGLYWQDQTGARYAAMGYVSQDMTTKANVWEYTLPFSVTEQFGEVQIAINAISNVTTKGDGSISANRTSYLCSFTVEESVVPNLPSAPDPSVYELIQQYLGVLNARTNAVPNAISEIVKTAPNAFRPITLGGVSGAEIVIENDLSTPNVPVGAASTILIPDTVSSDSTVGAWQPITDSGQITGYKTVITAAMHQQMRDGATSDDLWVETDETIDGVTTGTDTGYTVDNNGDITITVNDPVAMVVRVWNGKAANADSITDVVPNGSTENGDNIYNVILSSGKTAGEIIAPRGVQGKPGQGAPSDSIPIMDGVAAVGDEITYARGDHVHPSDTRKANISGNYPNMMVGIATKATQDGDGNKISETYVKVSDFDRLILETEYPVGGKPYIQYAGMPTPAQRWAGTSWEIDTTYQGRALVGSGGNYALGATGGEETHTFTVDEMPTHTHAYPYSNNLIGVNASSPEITNGINVNGDAWGNLRAQGNIMQSAGSSQPHNNMSPYIVVNYWKRTT